MTQGAEIRLAAGLTCDFRIARSGHSMRLMIPPPTSLAMQQGRADEVRRLVWHPRWRRWPKIAWGSHIDGRLNPTCHGRASKTARTRRAGTAAQPDHPNRTLPNVASKAISGRAKRQTNAPHTTIPRSSETCPSSNDVEQVAHSWSRRLGFIWFRSGWLALMGQAAVLDGLRLDASPVGQNGSTATEIDVAGGEVTEAFMVSASVAMIGEGGDGAFYFALHAVVLQQDAVLDGDWPIVCWTPCGFSFCCCTQGSVAGRSPRECGR